jgi:hypothetical protein
MRAERLSPAARKWGRNRGGMIFTEVPSTATTTTTTTTTKTLTLTTDH